MAKRICFIINKDNKVEEIPIEFKWISGLAFSQKVKCAASLSKAVTQIYPSLRHIEASTKSGTELGKHLSAFNLLLYGNPVESIYHSSKVFEDGSHFKFLKEMEPRGVIRFMRSVDRGKIVGFRYNGIDYPAVPVTAFYNWIYIQALDRSEFRAQVLNFEAFTDIEYNDNKKINCQARAIALYVAMTRDGKKDYFLQSFDRFLSACNYYLLK